MKHLYPVFLKNSLLFSLLAGLLFFSTATSAQVAITPATGGGNLCVGPTYTALTPIVIAENLTSDFGATAGAKSFVLQCPTNFAFQAGVGSFTFSSATGSDVAGSPTITVTATTITVDYDINSVTKKDTLTISGIMVKCTAAAGPSNIVRVSAGAGNNVSQNGNLIASANNHGTLQGYALPAAPTSASETYCVGQTINNLTVTGAGGATFNWYTAAPPGVPVFTGASYNTGVSNAAASVNTYYVTQTVNACEGPATTVTLTVLASAPPTPTASDITKCVGQAVPNFSATGTAPFTWYKDAGLSVSLGTGATYSSGFTGAAAVDTFFFVASGSGYCKSSPKMVRLIVKDTTLITVGGLPGTVCRNGSNLAVSGFPTGGTLSGTYLTGISGSSATFVPKNVPTGTNTATVRYTYVKNGCTSRKDTIINVKDSSNVSFTSPPAGSGIGYDTYYSNDPAVNLAASLAGGSFAGPGVSGSKFYPSIAGVNTAPGHKITYQVNNSFGCTSRISKLLFVQDPSNSFVGLNTNYCYSNTPVPISITGAPPESATLTYLGFWDTKLAAYLPDDPAFPGDKTHALFTPNNTGSDNIAFLYSQTVPDTYYDPYTYDKFGNYTGGCGCYLPTGTYSTYTTNYQNQNVNVGGAQAISFNLPSSTCSNGTLIDLAPNPNTGITWSVSPATPGLITGANKLDPSVVSVTGTYTITLSYSGSYPNCSNSLSQDIYIKVTDPFSMSGLNASYCSSDPAQQITITPNNQGYVGPYYYYGFISGTGASTDYSVYPYTYYFNPSLTAPGTNIPITYSVYKYFNVNGYWEVCTSTDTLFVDVANKATVNAGTPQTICSDATLPLSALSSSIGGSASSATWSTSGNGVFLDGLNNTNNVRGTAVTYDPGSLDSTAGTSWIYLTTNNPGAPCTAVKDSVQITLNPVAVVTAGSDVSICAGNPIFLDGRVSGAISSGTWTIVGGGSGTFSPNPTTLTAQYIPTQNELDNGAVVNFKLESDDPSGPCGKVSDFVTITIDQRAIVDAGPNQKVCAYPATVVNLNGSITGSVTTGVWTHDGAGNLSSNTSLTPTYTPAASELANGDTITFKLKADPTGNTCPRPTDSMTVIINPLPVVTFSGLDTAYCNVPNTKYDLVGRYGISPTSIFSGNFGVVGSPSIGYKFYPNNVGVGTWTVTYTYTDANTCTNSTSQQVKVNAVPTAIWGMSDSCEFTPITFQDLSTIPSSPPTTAVINQWLWSFSDSSFTTQNVTRQFAPSNYGASLQVTTNQGCTDTKNFSFVIGPYPKSKFNWKKICHNDTTQFTDASTLAIGSIVNWTWDFGDGKTISGAGNIPPGTDGDSTLGTFKNPKRIYANPGVYYVRLTVTSAKGCSDDSLFRVFILPTVKVTSSLPYKQDFDSGNSGFVADGTNYSWAEGTPAKTGMNGAASGNTAWATNLTGAYNSNEDSWVNCPCFDLSGLNRPMVSITAKSFSESGYDGAVLQSSLDGVTWQNVGAINDGINWYNKSNIVSKPGQQSFFFNGWSGIDTAAWKISRHTLDYLNQPASIRFRIAFASNGANNFGGFAFDDFVISERSKTVLLEHFTNTSSATVPEDNYVNNLITKKAKDMVSVQYHTSFPGTDPFNQFNKADPSARVLYYGVPQLSRSVLDGNFYNGNPAFLDTTKVDLKALEDPKFQVLLGVHQGTDSITTKVQVKALLPYDSLSGDLIVHTAVIERVITGVTGANGETSFEWVLKKMLPDAAGNLINKTWAVNDSAKAVNVWYFGSTDFYNPAQLAVVAFVQNNKTKEIYQTAYQLGPGGATNITKLHDPLSSLQGLEVFPNPGNDVMYAMFADAAKEELTWETYNQLGQVMGSGKLQKGSKGFAISTSDYAEGIYTLRIGNESGAVYQKLLVIH